MTRPFVARVAGWSLCLLLMAALATGCARSDAEPLSFPTPAVDLTPPSGERTRTAIFAGGCFWGIEAVFEHLKGVKDAASGYAGGTPDTADYRLVSSGRTGHAESVRVVYDPTEISYGQLLRVFFSVAHDPTQLNRQGPDAGPQYRSALFVNDADEQRVAQAYVDQLTQAKVFRRPIVTQIQPLAAFYRAEDYHQDYAARHPRDAYIMFHDAPKVADLKRQFPDLYRERS
jgi:peptide-methionine (S)-S-oxide reductase